MLYNEMEMNLASESALRSEQINNPYASQISNLLEEIELSLKWDRPSILLATYDSELTRNQAEEMLEERILSIGLNVTHIKVDKENFDLGSFLSNFDQHERVVFFISGLRWGGGRSRTNAYQALNLRRELFVSQKIRLIIWLNPREASDLPNHAPDFWAFRHRVVDLTDNYPKGKKNTANSPTNTKHNILSWRDWQINETPDGIDAKIKLRESILAGMQVDDASLFMRIELMYTLAFYYWLKQRFDKAISYLEQGLAVATHPDSISMRSKIQSAIGMIYHDQNNIEKSIHAFHKALALNQEDSHAWNNLGRALLDAGLEDKALDAYKRSTRINPRNANAWNNLGNFYRRTGKPEESIDSYKLATKFDPMNEIPMINQAYSHLAVGQPDMAIRAFKKASRIDPGNVVIHMKLGNIYREMNRYKDARRSYKQAIKNDPTYFPPYIGMLACAKSMKNPRTEKKAIAEALPFYEQQNELMKAAFEAQRGYTNEATRLLKIAIQKKLTTVEEISQNEFLNTIQEPVKPDKRKTG